MGQSCWPCKFYIRFERVSWRCAKGRATSIYWLNHDVKMRSNVTDAINSTDLAKLSRLRLLIIKESHLFMLERGREYKSERST